MTTKRRFRQVDVFGSGPISGNPLAVVHDAEGLDEAQMQAFTRWSNLSECTFLLPPSQPDADYRVRIFTLAAELPFAGHPTLGTCHAWLEEGGDAGEEVIVQECGAGLVPIRRSGHTLAFAAPPLIRSGPVDEPLVGTIRDVLAGVDIEAVQWVDNGPGWVGVMLVDAEAVLAAKPRFPDGVKLDIGLIGPHPPGSETRFEVRAFFTDDTGAAREDPVTGSLNASLAQWMYERGDVDGPYTVSQGTALGRTGRVSIDRGEDGTVWVGGATTTVVTGQIRL